MLKTILRYNQRLAIIPLLMLLILVKVERVVWLYLPLALQGARGGCGGIMTMLLIAGEGLLGRGLGMRCLLYCWRAHLDTEI